MADRPTVRRLGAVLAAPLDEGGRFRRGAPRLRGLYAVGGACYVVPEARQRWLGLGAAGCLGAALILERSRPPAAALAFASGGAALILLFLARLRTRRLVRDELARLVSAGTAFRIDRERVRTAAIGAERSPNVRYKVVVEVDGCLYGVALSERLRSAILAD